MRSVLTILMVSLFALPNSDLQSSDPRIATVPDGTITQKIYRNAAFEVSFEIRAGWSATLIPAGSVLFAPERSVADPVNKCSRALFSSVPMRASREPFGPKMTYFIFDPQCFPGESFPHSSKDRAAVAKFAHRVVQAFKYTPYIPPGGADFGGFDTGGRAFVTLVAEKDVALSGTDSAHGDTVHVNTLLMLIESSGYWIVMAEIVDDASKNVMQAGSMGVSKLR